MSTPTTNYGFIKAAEGEQYDVDIINNNLDAVDAQIKAVDVNARLERHAEFVRPLQNDEPAGNLWGPGAIWGLLDTTWSKNYSDWCSAGANDSIHLMPGVYYINWKIVNNHNASVLIWHTICTDGASAANANATSLGRTVTLSIPAADPYFNFANVLITAPAGQDIFFKFSCGTANVNLAHRIKITKIA
jgi:hypothetical protein